MLKRPPPKPTNLVDEFWEQLSSLPGDVSDIMLAPATATCWMLHHPIDVALDFTKRWLPAIMNADDQLKAFAQFWLPTHTERRNDLFNALVKQSCWERTSWIPFTRKVRVLPNRYAHNAFMFSALVAADGVGKYRVVAGRYTNAELRAGSSFCKNNCKPPIVDGRWAIAEERVMRHFMLDSSNPMSDPRFTVKLLRSMILTLMAPGGHTSFVIGLPHIVGGQLQFESLNIVKKCATDLIEVSSLSSTLMCQQLGRIKRPAKYVSHRDVNYDTDINLTMAAIHLHALAPEDRPAIHPSALDIERPANFGKAEPPCQEASFSQRLADLPTRCPAPEPVNTVRDGSPTHSPSTRDDSPTYSNDTGSTTYSE